MDLGLDPEGSGLSVLNFTWILILGPEDSGFSWKGTMRTHTLIVLLSGKAQSACHPLLAAYAPRVCVCVCARVRVRAHARACVRSQLDAPSLPIFISTHTLSPSTRTRARMYPVYPPDSRRSSASARLAGA